MRCRMLSHLHPWWHSEARKDAPLLYPKQGHKSSFSHFLFTLWEGWHLHKAQKNQEGIMGEGGREITPEKWGLGGGTTEQSLLPRLTTDPQPRWEPHHFWAVPLTHRHSLPPLQRNHWCYAECLWYQWLMLKSIQVGLGVQWTNSGVILLSGQEHKLWSQITCVQILAPPLISYDLGQITQLLFIDE